MKICNSIITLVLILPFVTKAQLQFADSEFSPENQTFNSGAPMGITDVNGDGLDDLIILDQTNDLYVLYQTEGVKMWKQHFIGTVSNQRNWCLAIADLDQYGPQDIFVGGGAGLKVFLANDTLGLFTETVINTSNFLTQSASLGDMDQDGDLDLFVCDDDADSYIGFNNGNGIFIEQMNVMDFSNNPPTDGSGNYGSVFCDYDRDGDLDFYLSKCRLGAMPGDQRRTNHFFEQTPSGFERIMDHPNLLSNDQSWVADFIDVDNDGDWDILLANHDAPMNLFIQQSDGSFVDEAAARGIDFMAGVIQLVSGDFDNDGDVDVFVPGTDHILFENDGTGNFSNGNFPESMRQIESATTGDLNNDGKLDIYAGYATPYNAPSTFADKIFINETASGHYVKFTLRSNTNNRFAIGATVEIFHQGMRQLREIRAGESYGITKTNTVHFGLGAVEVIDSVKIFWPSKAVQTFYNLTTINQTLEITEGIDEIATRPSILSSDTYLCADDTIFLEAPLSIDYEWSNGATTRTIAVTEAGVYTVKVLIDNQRITLPAYQVVEESVQKPTVIYDEDFIKCPVEAIELSANGNPNYLFNWNNGLTDTYSFMTNMDGEYFYEEIRYCGVFYSDTISIASALVESPIVDSDTVLIYQQAVLMSNDNKSLWSADTNSHKIFYQGQTLKIDSLAVNTVFYVGLSDTITQDTISAGLQAPGSNDGYHNTVLRADVYFDVHENITLHSVNVITETEGDREIIIRKRRNNAEVYRQRFFVGMGKSTLDLNVSLVANEQYLITTDSAINVANLGFESPDFMRGVDRVEYPITSKYLDVVGASLTTGQYYYFYNWVVEPEAKVCFSYWQPVYGIVDSISNTYDPTVVSTSVALYPNPSWNGELNIKLKPGHRWIKVALWNASGQLVEQLPLTGSRNDYLVRNLDHGVYFLKVIDERNTTLVKKAIILN